MFQTPLVFFETLASFGNSHQDRSNSPPQDANNYKAILIQAGLPTNKSKVISKEKANLRHQSLDGASKDRSVRFLRMDKQRDQIHRRNIAELTINTLALPVFLDMLPNKMAS